jgi:hypothetical protein
MKAKYDLHLSAYSISLISIRRLEELGFKRDEFANNTKCEATAYHGTFKGNDVLPSNPLWDKICDILNKDDDFSGGLEEEEYDEESIIHFSSQKVNNNISLSPLPIMYTEQPAIGRYKACDIHINIDLSQSALNSLKCLESLEVASFDRQEDNGVHRIFTITCETILDGLEAFSIIGNYLKCIPSLSGKIKIEKTTRFLRQPIAGTSLPLTSNTAFQDWKKRLEKVRYERSIRNELCVVATE